MATLKMTLNVPMRASLKFADIVPGNFGPQVRLKGSFDGQDGMVFLPGKVWANLKALKSAGVVAQGDYDEEPTAPVELPLLHRDVVLTRSQPAGAKYADLVVQTNGQTPPQAKPFEAGPFVPGLDEPQPYHEEPVVDFRAESAKAMLTLYRDCFAEALRMVKALNADQKTDLGFTSDNVCSITSTLFIEANRKGLVRLAA